MKFKYNYYFERSRETVELHIVRYWITWLSFRLLMNSWFHPAPIIKNQILHKVDENCL